MKKPRIHPKRNIRMPRMQPKYYAILILILGLASLWLTVFAINNIEKRSPRAEHALREADSKYGIIGIAAVSYLSATLLPFPGDAYFITAIKFSGLPILFFIVNLAMSTLGGLTNFYLARLLRKKWVLKHVDEDDYMVATGWLVFYGPVVLIAAGVSLAPFIFDAMTFVIGLSHIRTERFLKYCLLAKFLHFLVLALIAYRFIG